MIAKGEKSRKRTREQITHDRLQISELYLNGYTQAEIGEKLAINQSTVSRDLKVLRGQWLESSLRNFDAMLAEQLAKVDQQERDYHKTTAQARAWAQGLAKAAQLDKAAAAMISGVRAMQGVDSCIDRRCRILGLDAPARTEISGAIFDIAGWQQARQQRIDEIQ